MQIFKASLLLAALAIAGCDAAMVSRKAPQSIRLSDGTVVAGPRGWCVDPSTTKAGAETAVVVLGSCAAIAGNVSAPRPDVPGIVTVSLERETGVVPSAKELAAFLATEQGRAVLALDGRADSVRILESVVDGDRLYLRVKDDSVAPGTSSETWRVLFDLGGRFASISLYSQAGDSIDRADGFATLEDQADRLAAVNG